jgi:dihydroceramidase
MPRPPAPDALGPFGPLTASVDWCEENFAMSPFVAEFWNTISSVR